MFKLLLLCSITFFGCLEGSVKISDPNNVKNQPDLGELSNTDVLSGDVQKECVSDKTCFARTVNPV